MVTSAGDQLARASAAFGTFELGLRLHVDVDLDVHAQEVVSLAVPYDPDSGIAWRGSRATATRIRSVLPTMPLVGSNSTQPQLGR